MTAHHRLSPHLPAASFTLRCLFAIFILTGSVIAESDDFERQMLKGMELPVSSQVSADIALVSYNGVQVVVRRFAAREPINAAHRFFRERWLARYPQGSCRKLRVDHFSVLACIAGEALFTVQLQEDSSASVTGWLAWRSLSSLSAHHDSGVFRVLPGKLSTVEIETDTSRSIVRLQQLSGNVETYRRRLLDALEADGWSATHTRAAREGGLLLSARRHSDELMLYLGRDRSGNAMVVASEVLKHAQ